MIKRDPKAKFLYKDVGFFKPKRIWRFHAGKWSTQKGFTEEEFKSLQLRQQTTPVAVLRVDENKRLWWMFMDEVYWEDEGYSAEEMEVLIKDRVLQREKRVKRAVARISTDQTIRPAGRQPIPDEVKMQIWQRDKGRCTRCGSQEDLEFDHIIPVAMGGSNTARNLQLLCENCNRSKGAELI